MPWTYDDPQPAVLIDPTTKEPYAAGGGGVGSVAGIGNVDDPVAATDTGDATLIAMEKRLLQKMTQLVTAATDTTPPGVYDAGNSYAVITASAADSPVGNANDTIAAVILIPGDTLPAGSIIFKDGTTVLATIPAATLSEATPRAIPLFNIVMTTGFKITLPSDVTALVAYRAI